jgi:hypothetical protein
LRLASPGIPRRTSTETAWIKALPLRRAARLCWHTRCNGQGMRFSASSARSSASPVPEINLIAQRIVKLAEIATLEHLDSLMASQARTLVALARHAGELPDAHQTTPVLHRHTGVSPSLGGTDA